MRRNMLNNKFYKYGEKVYMLVATGVYLEYNCAEQLFTRTKWGNYKCLNFMRELIAIERVITTVYF